MTENNVDTNFVDGLQLIIDSLIKEDESDTFEESTAIEKVLPLAALGAIGGAVAGAAGKAVGEVVETGAEAAQQMSDTDEKGEGLRKNTEDLPEANHWCPDVMDWHTSDHEPAKAPSVHINVDNHNGDDPYKSENADKGVDKSLLPGGLNPLTGQPSVPKPKVEKGGYDQNTNLPPEFGKPEEGESIAEPFLRKREDVEEDIEKQEGSIPGDMGASETAVSMAMAREYNQSLDVLKIWASVDRVLPKDDELSLVDDLSILKSFGLETSTNIENLVEGTLVHKMLVDRASRPTKEWWESGLELAKSVEGMEEPAICTAFLYYEPDTFQLADFIVKASIETRSADQNPAPMPSNGLSPTMGGYVNDEVVTRSKAQDLEQPLPNSGGGSAMGGLGMSADELEKLDVQVTGPKDEDCDD